MAILTERDADALEVLRHSSAHVLATAVRELFPGAGIGFGPPIEDGFYYDFDVPRPFTPEDLERDRAARWWRWPSGISRSCARSWTRDEANRRFKDDPLKLERIGDLGDDETISVYTDGPFVDLCRGPARAEHRAAQALQAAARRGRLLARRRAPPDAPAHLRHRLVQEGGSRRLPPPAGGGAQARPSCHRQAARPLLDQRHRRARPGVLASEGRDDQVAALPRGGGRQRRERVRSRVHAARHPRGAVPDLRPPAALCRQPVPGHGGRARARRRTCATG